MELTLKHTLKILSMIILSGACAPVWAADTTQIELNSTTQSGDACRLTFTANAPFGLAALETQTVLFDTQGAVSTFTLFDFGEVPQNGLRVRQFDVPGTQCGDIGLILFNGVERCSTSDGASCEHVLTFASRVDAIEVQQ